MSAHVLLNLLNELSLRKEIKCKARQAFYGFFELISHDTIKIR